MGRLVLRGGWARLGLAGPGWGNLALGTLPSGDLAEWRPCFLILPLWLLTTQQKSRTGQICCKPRFSSSSSYLRMLNSLSSRRELRCRGRSGGPGAGWSREPTSRGEGKRCICEQIHDVPPAATGALKKTTAAREPVTGPGWPAEVSEEGTAQHTCPFWPSVSRSV